MAQGVHPAVLKEMMGHSSIDTTMKYYIHVMADSIGDAIKSVEFSRPHKKDDGADVIHFPKKRR